MILASLRCSNVELSIFHSSLIIAAGDHSSFNIKHSTLKSGWLLGWPDFLTVRCWRDLSLCNEMADFEYKMKTKRK